MNVDIGDIVYWYPDGDTGCAPHPAVVTQVGEQALTLNVMGPDTRAFMVRDSVVHASHPNARRPETRDNGAWAHTPATERLRRLEALVERLVKEKGQK